MKVSKSEIFAFVMATNIGFLILLNGVEQMSLIILIYVVLINIVGIIWGIKKKREEKNEKSI